MAIYRKYERDVDVLLAEEFEVSPPFANWFLEQVQGIAPLRAQVVDVCVSKSDYLGESDLVVLFEAAEASFRFALFIEDKIDAPLQPDQAERYRLRAKAGIDFGGYMGSKVVLCSPESYPKTHPGASLFDAFVSYESIAAYLGTRDPEDRRSLYRSNFLATAANRYTNSAAPIRDPGTTAFWKAAYEIATREFADLEMKSPVVSAGQTWVDFRPLDMPTLPRRVCVSLKGKQGFIDLTFAGSLARLFLPLVSPLLQAEMTVHQTGKSTAIRIVVEGFNVTDEAALSKVRVAFEACVRLIRFYRAHRQALNEAASASLTEPTAMFSLRERLSSQPVIAPHHSIQPSRTRSEKPVADRRVLLELGAEGGSIALLQVRDSQGLWKFRVTTNESLLMDELDFEDIRTSEPEYANSFSVAVELLDRYSWVHLQPLVVHADYSHEIFQAVRTRGGPTAEHRWQQELAQQG